MRERLGKSGSLIDFQQQSGDPRGRGLLIEIEHEILGPFGRVGPQLVDVQIAVLDDADWDRAGSRRAAKLLQPCIQSSPELGQTFAGSQRHGEPRGLIYRQWREPKLLVVVLAARTRPTSVNGTDGS